MLTRSEELNNQSVTDTTCRACGSDRIKTITPTPSRNDNDNDYHFSKTSTESQVLEIAKCRGCGSDRVQTVVCPPHSKHYGALRCGECDCFRGWAPKPSTTQKRLDRQREIAALLASPMLSDWQRGFLKSIENKKKLSPQQLQTLQTLKLLVGRAVFEIAECRGQDA